MFMYSLLMILPTVPCLFSRFVRIRGVDDETYKRASMFTFFFVVLFLCAFRANSVGNDSTNYFMMFKRFSRWSLSRVLTYKEPAFALLCKGISLLTDRYQWLVIVVSVISILPIIALYVDEIEYPMTTIALFVFTSNFYMLFSGMRQSIAISLGIIAYLMAKRKQPVRFLLSTALAFLFHRSALILVLMYPLCHIRLMKRSLFVVAPVMLLIYMFNRQIFGFLRGIIQDYGNIGNRESNSFMMLLLLIAFSVFSYVIPDSNQLDADAIGLRNLLLLTTAIQMFAPLNFLVMRMGYYYLIFMPITVPKMMQASSVRWRQVAIAAHVVILLFFTLHFFLFAPGTNTLNIFPYRFFWEVV